MATRNKGKVREIRMALRGACPRAVLLSLDSFPALGDLPEPYTTFAGNAAAKAQALALASGLPSLADDSGLEVLPLGGFPGVQSARFAGPEATDADRNAALIRRLRDAGIPEREWQARFVCVLALAMPEGAVHLFSGECDGVLVPEPRGTQGFGYDPIFKRPETGRTMAELTPGEKNACSHRGKALAALAEALPALLRDRESAADAE